MTGVSLKSVSSFNQHRQTLLLKYFEKLFTFTSCKSEQWRSRTNNFVWNLLIFVLSLFLHSVLWEQKKEKLVWFKRATIISFSPSALYISNTVLNEMYKTWNRLIFNVWNRQCATLINEMFMLSEMYNLDILSTNIWKYVKLSKDFTFKLFFSMMHCFRKTLQKLYVLKLLLSRFN